MYLIQIAIILLGIATTILGILFSQSLYLLLFLICLGPSVILFGSANLVYAGKERKSDTFKTSDMISFSLPKAACLASFVASVIIALAGYGCAAKGSNADTVLLGVVLLVLSFALFVAPMFYIGRKNRNSAIICSAITIAAVIFAAATLVTGWL